MSDDSEYFQKKMKVLPKYTAWINMLGIFWIPAARSEGIFLPCLSYSWSLHEEQHGSCVRFLSCRYCMGRRKLSSGSCPSNTSPRHHVLTLQTLRVTSTKCRPFLSTAEHTLGSLLLSWACSTDRWWDFCIREEPRRSIAFCGAAYRSCTKLPHVNARGLSMQPPPLPLGKPRGRCLLGRLQS